MSNRSNGTTEFTVNASAVVKLLIRRPGGSLVLDATDAANAHDENDQHEDKGHAQRANDDVQGVPRHIC